jgi:pimeloyl-ACP methyl ester carboxylesterase
MAKSKGKASTVKVFNMKIEVVRQGRGSPLVVFYDEEALALDGPLLDRLAVGGREVIVVSPPGFGKSDRPDWVDSIDDCAYICLDALDALKVNNADVIGFGVGGWLAAEMAVKTTRNMRRLVLVDPFGIKVGGRFDRDIQDIWFLSAQKVQELKYADEAKGNIDYTAMPESKLTIIARNKESYARFCWQPYMHNPKLKGRLHRIDVPTLVVWGEKDGIITPAYGRAFAKEIQGAKFALVKNAGHFPHVEQPDALLKLIDGFLGQARKPPAPKKTKVAKAKKTKGKTSKLKQAKAKKAPAYKKGAGRKKSPARKLTRRSRSAR